MLCSRHRERPLIQQDHCLCLLLESPASAFWLSFCVFARIHMPYTCTRFCTEAREEPQLSLSFLRCHPSCFVEKKSLLVMYAWTTGQDPGNPCLYLASCGISNIHHHTQLPHSFLLILWECHMMHFDHIYHPFAFHNFSHNNPQLYIHPRFCSLKI